MLDMTGTAGTATRSRSRAVEVQLATDYARDRLAKALYEVIVDGVEFGPRDLPTAEDREWIRGAIAIPLQEAAEIALHILAWRLTQALERAPDGLLDRFDASHRSRELGWD